MLGVSHANFTRGGRGDTGDKRLKSAILSLAEKNLLGRINRFRWISKCHNIRFFYSFCEFIARHILREERHFLLLVVDQTAMWSQRQTVSATVGGAAAATGT